MIVKRILAAVTAAVLLLMPLAGAHAQSWPQRPVKFICPLGPGSGADLTARLLSERLQKRWGQSVVVENRAGGDGIIAITSFLTSNDDHVLFFGPSASYTAHPYMRSSIPYNVKDIIPVARTSVTVVIVAVPSTSSVTSLRELMELSKKNPGKLNWSAATGLNEFQFMAYLKTAGVDMVRVPYRDLNQAVNDLGEDRIQVFSGAFAQVRPAQDSGKVKVIGVANTTRVPMLPKIETAKEAGFPALEFDGLVGVYSTPLVSREANERIEKDILEALKDPLIGERLTATGTLVAPGTAAEFTAAIENQKTVAAQTASVLGLKVAQ